MNHGLDQVIRETWVIETVRHVPLINLLQEWKSFTKAIGSSQLFQYPQSGADADITIIVQMVVITKGKKFVLCKDFHG